MKISVIKSPKPVLSHSLRNLSFTSKDSLWAYHPVVVEKGKKFYLFYTGKSLGMGISHHLLCAESEDLPVWKKNRAEVLTTGEGKEWDSDFLAHSYVFQDKDRYRMLYDGSRKGNWLEEIGLAESRDLTSWRKDAGNPVFTVDKNSPWDWRHVSRCSIYKKDASYNLFYAGHDGVRERIGLARGKDITKLKRIQDKPVLDVGKEGTWDEKSISDPRVISWNGTYLMFYSGMDANGIERVGAAESKNLIDWQKYRGNPVLDISPGKWDAISASRASLFLSGKKLYIFYSGRKRFFYHIGMAEVEIR